MENVRDKWAAVATLIAELRPAHEKVDAEMPGVVAELAKLREFHKEKTLTLEKATAFLKEWQESHAKVTLELAAEKEAAAKAKEKCDAYRKENELVQKINARMQSELDAWKKRFAEIEGTPEYIAKMQAEREAAAAALRKQIADAQAKLDKLIPPKKNDAAPVANKTH